MKRLTTLFLLLFMLSSGFAQNMKVLLSHKAFCTDKMHPYIEFMFIVKGNSVQYALFDDNKYEAEIKINVDIKQNDSTITSLHYILSSETFVDSLPAVKPDFMDIENVAVANGEYYLYYTIEDMHADSSVISYIDLININYDDTAVNTSGISLLRNFKRDDEQTSFSKYGYDMYPLLYNFVPESQYALPFVMEVYNTEKMLGKGSAFYAHCHIEYLDNPQTGIPNADITMQLKSAPVAVVLNQLNVFKLPSGNYNLVIDLLTKDSMLLTTNKVFFQRSNPSIVLELADYDVSVENTFVEKISDKKTLEGYVACLYPIATPMEQDFFDKRMKKVSMEMLQRFFYSFWLKRNNRAPEAEWNKYKKQVDYVQQHFGSKIVKGYRTDRGRVYLQYGPPNDIVEAPFDPLAYPYEIWHYYYIGNQNNVKFVFWSPADVTNEYELLHSDKYGEPKDYAWQLKLTKRIYEQHNFDITKPEEYYGGEMEENWKLHR